MSCGAFDESMSRTSVHSNFFPIVTILYFLSKSLMKWTLKMCFYISAIPKYMKI